MMLYQSQVYKSKRRERLENACYFYLMSYKCARDVADLFNLDVGSFRRHWGFFKSRNGLPSNIWRDGY